MRFRELVETPIDETGRVRRLRVGMQFERAEVKDTARRGFEYGKRSASRAK
jgi:hypothetical protein